MKHYICNGKWSLTETSCTDFLSRDRMGMVILQLAQAIMMQHPPINMNPESIVEKEKMLIDRWLETLPKANDIYECGSRRWITQNLSKIGKGKQKGRMCTHSKLTKQMNITSKFLWRPTSNHYTICSENDYWFWFCIRRSGCSKLGTPTSHH